MREIVTVIEMGTSKIDVLIAERAAHDRIDVLGLGSSPYAGYFEGEWNEPGKLHRAMGTALDMAQEESKKRIREVYIGVPGEFCYAQVEQVNRVLDGRSRRITQNDVNGLFSSLDHYARPRGYEPLHQKAIYYTLDGRTSLEDVVGQQANKFGAQVSCVLGQSAFMDAVEALMNKLGVPIADFIATPLAQGLLYVPDTEDHKPAVVLDVGYLSTSVIGMENRGMFFLANIPIGGGHIAADLAMGLGISLEGAEQLKRRFVFGLDTSAGKMSETIVDDKGASVICAHDKIQAIVEHRLNDLCHQVVQTFGQMNLRNRSQTPVYMIGGGVTMMRGAREYISSKTRLPIRNASLKSARITSPTYAAAMALMEFAFAENQESSGGFLKLPKFKFNRK